MFIKILVFCFVLLSCSLNSFAFSEYEISSLEQNKYGQSFENESLSERLNRLETDYFGMSQTGDINSRLDMLSKLAVNSKGSAIITPDYDYYSVSKKNKSNPIKNFWNNISEPFSQGVVTGYTPPISFSNSYSSYGNNFMNFLNGRPEYCPYHNKFHNHNFNNSDFNSNNFLKNPHYNHLSDNRHRHRLYRPHRTYSSPYRSVSQYNPFGSPYSMPTNAYTNVAAGSRVHILRDWFSTIKKRTFISSLLV